MSKVNQIRTNILLLIVLMYILLTNFSDVKKGIIDGWNAVEVEEKTMPALEE